MNVEDIYNALHKGELPLLKLTQRNENQEASILKL